MARRCRIKKRIIEEKCRNLRWEQIESVLGNKDFIIDKKGKGTEITISHELLKSFKKLGKFHDLSEDGFNVHAQKGRPLNSWDCEKIGLALTQLGFSQC